MENNEFVRREQINSGVVFESTDLERFFTQQKPSWDDTYNVFDKNCTTWALMVLDRYVVQVDTEPNYLLIEMRKLNAALINKKPQET